MNAMAADLNGRAAASGRRQSDLLLLSGILLAPQILPSIDLIFGCGRTSGRPVNLGRRLSEGRQSRRMDGVNRSVVDLYLNESATRSGRRQAGVVLLGVIVTQLQKAAESVDSHRFLST